MTNKERLQFKRVGRRQFSMLEHLPAGVLLTSVPEQAILYQNHQFVQMFGYTTDEFPTFLDWCHLVYPDPDYCERFVQVWNRRIGAICGKNIAIDPIEVSVTAKDGNVWFVRIHASIVDGVNLITFFDLTNRRRMREELNQKTQDLDRFFNVSMDLLCIADTGGYFRQLNPAWEHVLGYPLAELKSCQITEFVNPEDREKTWDAISHLASQKEIYNFVNRYRCKQGGERWLEWQAVSVGNTIYAAGRDISERRRVEDELSKYREHLEERVKDRTAELDKANFALLEMTERLTLATQAASIGVWEMDISNNMLAWDDKMFQIYGLPKADTMTHEAWKKNVYPEDVAKVCASLLRTLDSKANDTIEFRIIRTDGQVRWISAAQGVMLDKQDQVARIVGTNTDITERKNAQSQLSASERHFRALFERPLVGMATMTPSTNWLEVNDQLCNMLGYSRDELLQKSWEELTFPVDQARNQAQLKLILSGQADDYTINKRCLRKDNSLLYAQTSVSCLRKADGSVDYLVMLVVDVSGQHQAQEKLRKAAYHDALTQLPNRRLLVDRLQQSIAKASRQGDLLAICYLDLDGFKAVNDQLGHTSGDQLLIQVANRLNACVRGGDTVARLGGDEFVVLLCNITSEEECRQILGRILNAVAAPYDIADTEQSGISTSIGVTLFPDDHTDPDILLRHADHAMYTAKQMGRNCFIFFSELNHQALVPEITNTELVLVTGNQPKA